MDNLLSLTRSGLFTSDEYDAIKDYSEYKKLRAMMYRPIRAFDDVDGILQDLQGKNFYQ